MGETVTGHCPACEQEVEYEANGEEMYCPICGRTPEVAATAVATIKKGKRKKRVRLVLKILGVVIVVPVVVLGISSDPGHAVKTAKGMAILAIPGALLVYFLNRIRSQAEGKAMQTEKKTSKTQRSIRWERVWHALQVGWMLLVLLASEYDFFPESIDVLGARHGIFSQTNAFVLLLVAFAPFITNLASWLRSTPKENAHLSRSRQSTNSPVVRRSAESLAISFIRNSGSHFDSLCRQHRCSKLFYYNGPFFAWAILWLAMKIMTKPNNELKNITIRALNRVLKVDHQYALQSIDKEFSDNDSEIGFLESGKLVGIDMEDWINDISDAFIPKLEIAINSTLNRIQSNAKYKFVPILNLLLSRHPENTSESDNKFDMMNDDEFEYIFLEQCVESLAAAKSMAIKIVQALHQQQTQS